MKFRSSMCFPNVFSPSPQPQAASSPSSSGEGESSSWAFALFMFRLKGTVILRIWWQLGIVLLYSAGVTCYHFYVRFIEFPQTLINVLGVVIGLLLVFRTNTAYDRYWEGRRLWSTLIQNIRTLTRLIWVGVREPHPDIAKDIVEKKSVLNLLVAFAYATKNYLRGEYNYEDVELIGHLPKFNRGMEQCAKRSIALTIDEKDGIDMKRKRRQSVKNSEEFLKAHDCIPPTNIPVELSYYIQSYLVTVSVKGRDLTDPSTMLIMNHALNNLMDCLTNLERILRTPIPLAYSVHLHHSIWLYLLTLPYQLMEKLGWWTIPACVLSAFALLGILGIGWEIENPFGYDDNDLPLDDFCACIKKEIQIIIGQKIPSPESWVFSENNFPFSDISTPDGILYENAIDLSVKNREDVFVRKDDSSCPEGGYINKAANIGEDEEVQNKRC